MFGSEKRFSGKGSSEGAKLIPVVKGVGLGRNRSRPIRLQQFVTDGLSTNQNAAFGPRDPCGCAIMFWRSGRQ